MDPLSASLFTSIGSAFKFADVAMRVAEVGSENAVFVRAIQVVRSDLEEVERLLSQTSVQQKLALTYGKIHWIKTAIKNTRNALNEIGRWVERARVEQESTGSIRFDTRVRWVFSDHEKLVNRKIELSTCHQQLSNVLGYLIGLEGAPVHTTLQEPGDATYDDIVARHRRKIRPQVQNANYDYDLEEKKHGISEPPAKDPVWGESNRLPPASRYCSPPNTQVVIAPERDNTLRSPSLASTSSPPGSPPPTYANAVSIQILPYSAQANTARTNRAASASLVAYSETASPSSHDETWAYKSTLADSAFAELAGDTVVLSGTNSAGPVNPYELCDSPSTTTYHNTGRSQGLYAGLAELMGDLHFSTEPIKNDPGPLPESRPRRSAFDQVGPTQNNFTGLQYRTMSETAPVIRRRPIPTHALSDSLLTIHELPPLLAPGITASTVSKAHPLSYARPSTSESPSGLLPQVRTSERPSSYSTRQSQQDSRTSTPVPNRHYSAPPAPVSYSGHVATTSAESTNSRAIGTQPKEPRTIPGLDSVKATRMQSQKRMMDLLSSIGT